jgi:hypothetical protein
MSVEKYLENIKLPEDSPGPFSVRLRYNLKNQLYERHRKRERLQKFVGNLALVMFILVSVMIYRPNLAATLHDNLLCRTGIINNGNEDEKQLLAEQRQAEIELPDQGRFLGMAHSVSTSGRGYSPYQIMELSDLPEETPYIIRKVKDSNNRHIYILTEIEAVDNRRQDLY